MCATSVSWEITHVGVQLLLRSGNGHGVAHRSPSFKTSTLRPVSSSHCERCASMAWPSPCPATHGRCSIERMAATAATLPGSPSTLVREPTCDTRRIRTFVGQRRSSDFPFGGRRAARGMCAALLIDEQMYFLRLQPSRTTVPARQRAYRY